MTPDVRNQKKTIMRLRFQQACEAHQEGNYEEAAQRISQIYQMVSSYRGVDSDLYWFALNLTITWGEFFLQNDTRDFNAWAMGQACSALRAAA
ncbi:hypothetical protein [Marinobacter adhaerens]|uniref:hypothetical protein n=1 Tax=Marinobacter adhaerens TaxID=1033846 RepID=UPI001E39EAEC|nr:hypothetical protein [Marinobacter adhaerens]MCD1646973.1 hypothetical protein [Marinobacter adhaerens]